jgi:hypothetical protein
MAKLLEIDTSRLPEEPLFPSRFGGDERLLKTSLQTYGLLRPARLLELPDGFGLIDGAMRVALAREIGMKKIPCHVHEAADLEIDGAFLLCVELNSWDRDFNIVEKAQLIRHAHEVYKGRMIPKIFWHSIKIPQNIRTIQQHKDLLRLPIKVQKYAVNNSIPLSVVLEFLKFRKDELEKLANQLFVLPLNQNKLAEILSLLQDICKHEERSPLNVLDQILPQLEAGTAQQKEQKLRQVLHQMRNPHYEGKLKDFEEKVTKISAGEHTKITPAPFFEEKFVEINARIHGPEDLDALAAALKDENWKDLF